MPMAIPRVCRKCWHGYASGTNGSQQVGIGTPAGAGTVFHAVVWGGTAASAVDLNPAGFTYSGDLRRGIAETVALLKAAGSR